jgi:dTDP-glucose 4,6-dehydratase
MKKVLVTGGAGFLGSNFVVRSLSDRNHLEITVLDSLTYAGNLDNLKEVSSAIRFIHADIRDADAVRNAALGQDLIVHFAAESHNDNSLKSPELFIETNVVGTANLIEAALKNDAHFHHISTDEVFGDFPLGTTFKFTEESVYRPSSPYSASKASSDLLVRAWVRSFGLRATITNCSNNYGPKQNWEKFIPNSIRHAALGKKIPIYGTGLNVRDWINVDDHTTGIWAAIERGQIGETYLLGANNERTNLDVARQLLHALDKDESLIEFVEDRKGHDLRYAIDASKARNELGWNPSSTSFEIDLDNLAKFYASLLTNQS